jgi:hypothetical protein
MACYDGLTEVTPGCALEHISLRVQPEQREDAEGQHVDDSHQVSAHSNTLQGTFYVMREDTDQASPRPMKRYATAAETMEWELLAKKARETGPASTSQKDVPKASKEEEGCGEDIEAIITKRFEQECLQQNESHIPAQSLTPQSLKCTEQLPGSPKPETESKIAFVEATAMQIYTLNADNAITAMPEQSGDPEAKVIIRLPEQRTPQNLSALGELYKAKHGSVLTCMHCKRFRSPALHVCNRLHLVCSLCMYSAARCKRCRSDAYMVLELNEDKRDLLRSLDKFHCPGLHCNKTGRRKVIANHMLECPNMNHAEFTEEEPSVVCAFSVPAIKFNEAMKMDTRLETKPTLIRTLCKKRWLIVSLSRDYNQYKFNVAIFSPTNEFTPKRCAIRADYCTDYNLTNTMSIAPVEIVSNVEETYMWGTQLALPHLAMLKAHKKGDANGTDVARCIIYEYRK